jgi:hypothetical protein
MFGVGLFFAIRYQLAHPPAQRVAVNTKKVELADRIRVALGSAAEAEKSAVLAVTDKESIDFADEARAATANAELARTELATLLHTHGTAQENDLMNQFSRAFSEFQRIDKELLDLAVKNTNVKASALAFGPAAQAIADMDGALSRLIHQTAISTSAKAKDTLVILAEAQAAALRIEVLLPPHIAEESDQKMDELEKRMGKEDEAVRHDLSRLETLVPSGSADLKQAASSYARFADAKAQIIKLSRENTNVRSLSISLNQKRKVTAQCQDALAALARAIDEERAAATTRPPPVR